MSARRPLPASVPGVVAAWLLRKVDENDVRTSVRSLRAYGRTDVAEQLATAYLDLREAAKQFLEAAEGADPGGSALPDDDEDGPSEWVDCPAAAAALGVGDRRVRQLLTDGRLHGRKVGGRWLVDAADVALRATDRRLAHG